MFKRTLYYSDGKKMPPFWLFIAPIVISLVVGIPLVTRYPVPIAILLVSFVIIFISILLYALYGAFITNRYVQKHDFQLWKKSKSSSLRERREASKQINSLIMQTPRLEKSLKRANTVAFMLFVIWTLLFLGIFLFIILSET